MQQAATALMKGGLAAPRVSAKTIAEQLAEKINQKLNYVPQVCLVKICVFVSFFFLVAVFFVICDCLVTSVVCYLALGDLYREMFYF